MLTFSTTSRFCSLLSILLHVLSVSGRPVEGASQFPLPDSQLRKDTSVLILGGGVAGVAAAQALQENGISDFIIVEARDELGGRMMNHPFGTSASRYNVEVGANWIQGTETKGGLENPIWKLGKKHNITTRSSMFLDISMYWLVLPYLSFSDVRL